MDKILLLSKFANVMYIIAAIIGIVLLCLLIRFLCSVPTQLWRIANALEDLSDTYDENNKKS